MVGKRARSLEPEDSEVDRAFERLEEVQKELREVNEKAREKIKKIEHKYKEIRDPVYAKRNTIISTIPNFWFTAFLRHPILKVMLTEYDQKIFDYMDNVSVEDFPDPRKGYSIKFTFKVNPYFENQQLTKTIKFSDDGTLTSMGSYIMWKQGQGPNVTINNATSGYNRPLPFRSFFNWFSYSLMDIHLDMVAEIIKEDIWPNPMGLNIGEDEYADDDEDEEEDEDDDEEDDGSRGGT